MGFPAKPESRHSLLGFVEVVAHVGARGAPGRTRRSIVPVNVIDGDIFGGPTKLSEQVSSMGQIKYLRLVVGRPRYEIDVNEWLCRI